MTRPATKQDIWQAIELLDALPKPRGTKAETVMAAYEIALDQVSAEYLRRATESWLRLKTFFPSPSELYNEIKRLEERDSSRSKPGQASPDPDDEVLTPGQKLGYPLLKDDPAGRERANALWANVRPTFGAPGSQFDPQSKAERKKAKRLFKAMQSGHGATPEELREAGFPRHAEEVERRGGPIFQPEPEADDDPNPENLSVIDREIAEAKVRDRQRGAQEPSTEAERLERIRQIGHQPTQPTEALLRTLKNPMNPE